MSQNGLDVYGGKSGLCGSLSAKHSYTDPGYARALLRDADTRYVLIEAARDLLVIQISCNRPKTLHYKISLTFRSFFV